MFVKGFSPLAYPDQVHVGIVWVVAQHAMLEAERTLQYWFVSIF